MTVLQRWKHQKILFFKKLHEQKYKAAHNRRKD